MYDVPGLVGIQHVFHRGRLHVGARCRSSSVSYLSCATYCYILILDYLHGTHSISGGTLSVDATVIGAAALMIYSKWAWRKTVGKIKLAA